MRFILALFCVMFLSLPAAAHSYKTAAINIGHPWTMPTNTGSTEVYLSLLNMGEKDDQLTGAITSLARKITLQELRTDKQGTSTVTAISLPVKRGVSLRPGGSFIKLDGLQGPLTVGDKFTLRLTFAEAKAVDVQVFVEDHGQQHGE